MPTARFPIRFTGLSHAMRLLGLTPGNSWVEVGDGRLRVRMGWAFRADVPLESVRGPRLDDRRVWGWGVHGWAGRWLVNGSSSGIVCIDLEPQGFAKLGPVLVTLRELRVSVEDPRGFLAALAIRP
jgi:hypothetical protein